VTRAIFFDWFNTLARYEPPREELHSQLLHEFGIDVSPSDLMPGLLAADKYFFTEGTRTPVSKRSPEEQAKFYIHYANIMLSEVGVRADNALILQIIKKWPQVFGRIRFALFDDVLATFKTLKESQLILGLLTNATKDTISIHRELGLEPYLNFVVTSEEAKADKPKPEIFLLALERAGVDASEAVHVGDQYDLDVVGARGVGISPILIDRYDLYPEVSDCPRVHGLTELAQYL
jgi:HAD superfamily hydrolase (TIGR01549 family)